MPRRRDRSLAAAQLRRDLSSACLARPIASGHQTDIASANGGVPAIVRDRRGSGDDMTRIGAPLQVAQRIERGGSYEASPIILAARTLPGRCSSAPTALAAMQQVFGGTWSFAFPRKLYLHEHAHCLVAIPVAQASCCGRTGRIARSRRSSSTVPLQHPWRPQHRLLLFRLQTWGRSLLSTASRMCLGVRLSSTTSEPIKQAITSLGTRRRRVPCLDSATTRLRTAAKESRSSDSSAVSVCRPSRRSLEQRRAASRR